MHISRLALVAALLFVAGCVESTAPRAAVIVCTLVQHPDGTVSDSCVTH